MTATSPAAITPATSPVLRVAPAAPADAAAYFRASLVFHADVSDVAAALKAEGDPGFVVLDSRSTESWDQGHIPGAIHLPTALIAEQAGQLLDRNVPVVTYCWGPGCNGATRAAFALAELGYQVKEMLGGFEYYVREGYPVEGEQAHRHNKDQSGLVTLPGETMVGCSLPSERSGPSATPMAPAT